MGTKLQIDEAILAPDLNLRPAQWTDVNAVAELILAVCIKDGDPTITDTPEDIGT